MPHGLKLYIVYYIPSESRRCGGGRLGGRWLSDMAAAESRRPVTPPAPAAALVPDPDPDPMEPMLPELAMDPMDPMLPCDPIGAAGGGTGGGPRPRPLLGCSSAGLVAWLDPDIEPREAVLVSTPGGLISA